MRAKGIVLGVLFLAALAPAAPMSAAAAPAAPAWKLSLTSVTTNFAPDSSGKPTYVIAATNVGGATATGEITVTDTLPAGLTFVTGGIYSTDLSAENSGKSAPCTAVGQTVTCAMQRPVPPGLIAQAEIEVQVEPGAPAAVTDEATIGGGGAAADASARTTTGIDSQPPPFDFLAGEAGLRAPLSEADGSPATQAGSHPYQLTVDLGFPFVKAGEYWTVTEGGLRDASSDLPPGLLVDPAASSVLCTEVQLTLHNCPDGSQIGVATILSTVANIQSQPAALYNMVPPPGAPSSFGFDVGSVGIYAHVLGSVRSDGDFGLSGGSTDIVSLGKHPVLGVSLELWGDPSSDSHDYMRGICVAIGTVLGKPCSPKPDEYTGTGVVTLPGDCPGHPTLTRAHADSWGQPGLFHEATYESADLQGNPVSVSGCNSLGFAPTITVKPTTDLADSPAGLDVDLHQPQQTQLESLATAALKEATVTLPEGLVANPSQANGLKACSAEQIGTLTPVGQTPAHFSAEPSSCPDASKIGTVEVSTPLLAQIDPETHAVVHDPETGQAVPRPLAGSIFLAKPFENPFGSLLAIYLTVEDPRSGTYAKLAGRVEPDPRTGQLTTRFEDNPQLPLEDVRLHLFEGARASLITPPVCGTHTTSSVLVPWSSPEGADATPSDSFQTTAAPGGGNCPTAATAAPNAPAFAAGTIAPAAGAYSPFVLRLSREDGSQRLGGIETTLPPGLAARFVGVPYCSEAQIAQAQSRSHPDEGILEQRDPSCPAASQIGTVEVGAGAGPTPIYTSGHAYLAGPYKGAPLSIVIITPAIAGPFDLGAVLVRTALYVNPRTAQGRAVSDPLPQILDGIPLDVRSVALKLDRPDFTLNPTSCDPMAIAGAATSASGQAAALTAPFQVGGCSSLAFKPKLSIKLSGGTKRSKNPALKATLRMPAGGANIAQASVALPHSEFLDQGHIRTVCTRVQFAAAGGNGAGCPAGSVYGRARAVTPLLDAPLEGPVFLRSNPEHKLPDLVAALGGQIDVELVGRIDSANGGIRTTFEGVPDAPVSNFVLEMQGGKKGLLENSVNLCRSTNRATALFDGQNGKVRDFNPVVGNGCKGRKKKGKAHGGKHHRRR
jgi:uncharacterized repeat protein (TIGR01451 family)